MAKLMRTLADSCVGLESVTLNCTPYVPCPPIRALEITPVDGLRESPSGKLAYEGDFVTEKLYGGVPPATAIVHPP
jgi:hypothetical protein